MQLPPLVLDWAANAAQTFSIQWQDSDGDDIDLTGTTVRLVISKANGADATLNATVSNSGAGPFTTWTFTSGQSDPAYIGRPVRLEWVYAGETYLMAAGQVVPA